MAPEIRQSIELSAAWVWCPQNDVDLSRPTLSRLIARRGQTGVFPW